MSYGARELRFFFLLLAAAITVIVSPDSSDLWNIEYVSRDARASNDDAFSTFQSRLSSLARVVNGITLFNGLVDESIPADEAIAELMNFGSINLTYLESFNTKEVDEFIEKIEEASENMSNETAEAGNMILHFIKMKSMWNNSDDFKALTNGIDLDKLKVFDNLEMGYFDQFGYQKYTVDRMIEDLKIGSEASVDKVKYSLKVIANLSELVTKIAGENGIVDVVESFRPVQNLRPVFDLYDQGSSPQYERFFKSADIEHLKNDVEFLENVQPGNEGFFTAISSLLLSRSADTSFEKHHSSGFIHGYKDLGKLSEDVKDDWINKSIGLSASLNDILALTKLENQMSGLDGMWELISTSLNKESIRKAEFIQQRLGTFTGASKTIHDIFEYLKLGAFEGKYSSPEFVRFDFHVRTFQDRIFDFESLSNLSSEYADDINNLISSNQTSIKQILSALDIYKVYMKNTQELKIDVKNINSELLGNIKLGWTNDIARYIKFFNYLGKMPNVPSSVTEAINLVFMFRELTNDTEFYSSLKSVPSAISASSKLIPALRTMIGDFKKKPSTDVGKMKALNDLQKYSKVLGDSSIAVHNIQKVLEKRNDILRFNVLGPYVLSYNEEPILSHKSRFYARDCWIVFEELSRKLMTHFEKFRKFKDEVMKSNFETFGQLGSILEKLDGLGDMYLDADRRISVISHLNRTDWLEEMDPLKSSIRNLSTLDLLFARFNPSLSKISETLEGISLVFASSGRMASTEASTRIKPTVDTLILESETKTENGTSIWVIVVLTVVGISVLGAIGYLIYRWKFSKKPKSGGSNTKIDGDGEKSKNSKSEVSKESSSGAPPAEEQA